MILISDILKKFAILFSGPLTEFTINLCNYTTKFVILFVTNWQNLLFFPPDRLMKFTILFRKRLTKFIIFLCNCLMKFATFSPLWTPGETHKFFGGRLTIVTIFCSNDWPKFMNLFMDCLTKFCFFCGTHESYIFFLNDSAEIADRFKKQKQNKRRNSPKKAEMLHPCYQLLSQNGSKRFR